MDKVRNGFEATTKYLREVRSELKRVIWPDRKQTITLTMVVLFASGLVGGIIWVFDAIVGKLMTLLIGS